MPALVRPVLLVRRPAGALLQQWPPALDGSIDAIHQARVATRRLRELMPSLARAATGPEVARLRRALRDLTRTLGPSRELDVSLQVLDALAPQLAGHRAAIAFTRRLIAAERADAAATLREAGSEVDVGALTARIGQLARDLDSPAAVRRSARLVADRLGRRARALQGAVLAAGIVYAWGPLHAVRIWLKKFRYAFEIAEGYGNFHLGGTLRRLKGLQDVLGDMHDLQVLAAHVRDGSAAAPASLRPPMERLADRLDDEVRSLHGRFVVERAALVPVLARAARLRQRLVRLDSPRHRSPATARRRPAR